MPIGVERGPPDGELDSSSVLVVDDDEHWRWATAQLLERETGFTVETAQSLETARNQFAALDPDCVVCDYDLGDGDGLSLLAAVRRIDANLPFLLVTGKGNESVASTAIRRGVTDYIEKGCDNEDDLLVSRVQTLVKAHRTERALAQQRRMKTAVLDILRETASETDLCREFCRQLVQNGPYGLAWIGTTSTEGEPLPRTSAGRDQYLDVINDTGTFPAAEPACVAWDRTETVIVPVEREPGADEWEIRAAEHGFQRVIAVPIQHDGITFGVLAVYLISSAGDNTQADLIEEYAESVGYALQSLDQKRALLSSQPVQVDLVVADRDVPLVALAERITADTSIRSPSVVSRADGTTVYLCQIEGQASDTIESAVATLQDVSLLDLTTRSDRVKCTIAVQDTTPEEILVTNGARFEQTNVTDGEAKISVHLREDKRVAQIVTAVEHHYADVTVSTVWTNKETSQVTENPFGDLTERQEEVLRHAFHEGYFEQPREANATEIAERIGICRQTFAQHLRAAERKVFGTWQSTDRS